MLKSCSAGLERGYGTGMPYLLKGMAGPALLGGDQTTWACAGTTRRRSWPLTWRWSSGGSSRRASAGGAQRRLLPGWILPGSTYASRCTYVACLMEHMTMQRTIRTTHPSLVSQAFIGALMQRHLIDVPLHLHYTGFPMDSSVVSSLRTIPHHGSSNPASVFGSGALRAAAVW